MSRTALAVVALLAGQVSMPPTTDVLSARIAVLENDQKLLQGELAQLREQVGQLTEAARGQTVRAELPAPSLTRQVSIAGAPSTGSPHAPLVLIEFSDFQCPFCAAHYQRTWPEIDRQYVQTGFVRYVVRDLPLERIHPYARRAALAGSCANQQGRFWEFRHEVFSKPAMLKAPDFLASVEPIVRDGREFADCVASNAGQLEKQIDDARSYGFRSTPTFVLGRLADDGSVTPVKTIVGARPFEVFDAAIRTASAAVEEGTGPRKD